MNRQDCGRRSRVFEGQLEAHRRPALSQQGCRAARGSPDVPPVALPRRLRRGLRASGHASETVVEIVAATEEGSPASPYRNVTPSLTGSQAENSRKWL